MIIFQVLIPLVLLPFLISWTAKKLKLKAFYAYLTLLIFCLVYPFLLLNVFHFKDGAANAGLIAVPIFMIPVALFIQYLANVLFYEVLSNNEDTK